MSSVWVLCHSLIYHMLHLLCCMTNLSRPPRTTPGPIIFSVKSLFLNDYRELLTSDAWLTCILNFRLAIKHSMTAVFRPLHVRKSAPSSPRSQDPPFGYLREIQRPLLRQLCTNLDDQLSDALRIRNKLNREMPTIDNQ